MTLTLTRYFVLYNDGKLKYYDSRSLGDEKGSLDLRFFALQEVEEDMEVEEEAAGDDEKQALPLSLALTQTLALTLTLAQTRTRILTPSPSPYTPSPYQALKVQGHFSKIMKGKQFLLQSGKLALSNL